MSDDSTLIYIDLTEADVCGENAEDDEPDELAEAGVCGEDAEDNEPDELVVPGVWGFSGAATAAGEGMWCIVPSSEEVSFDAPGFRYASAAHTYVFCGSDSDWADINQIVGALPAQPTEGELVNMFPGASRRKKAARAAARLAWRAGACGGTFAMPLEGHGIPTFTPLVLIQTPQPLEGFTATDAGSYLDGRACENDGYSLYEIDVASGHQPSEWNANWRARLRASWAEDVEGVEDDDCEDGVGDDVDE